jgi:hypothetical protein
MDVGVVVTSAASGLTGDGVSAEEQAAISSGIATTTVVSKRDVLVFTVNVLFILFISLKRCWQ